MDEGEGDEVFPTLSRPLAAALSALRTRETREELEIESLQHRVPVVGDVEDLKLFTATARGSARFPRPAGNIPCVEERPRRI